MSHSKYSPSKAHQLLVCNASSWMQRTVEDRGSDYAAEGNAAHDVAEDCLRAGRLTADAFLGTTRTVEGRTFDVDDDMVRAVNVYLSQIYERIKSYELQGYKVEMLVEQRVDLSELLGLEGEGGTADCVLIATRNNAPAIVDVIDLKYGRGVEVSAVENPQLALYAAGVLADLELAYDIGTVNLIISQPRIKTLPSDWETTPGYIRNLTVSYHDAIWVSEEIYAGKRDPRDYLNPEEDACMFCRVKATCPALAAKVQEEILASFDEVADMATLKKSIPTPTETWSLGQRMRAVGLIEDWCSAVRAEVEKRLVDGVAVDGFKLVRGRRGPRQWTDPSAVEQELKRMRIKVEDMYDLKLISPTSAEKLVKSEVIGPRQWKTINEFVHQPDGKLSVAPVSDPRPEEKPAASADEFDVVG